MKKSSAFIATCALALLLGAPVAAFADPGHGHGHGNGHWRHGDDDERTAGVILDDTGITADFGGGVSIHIGTEDRNVIRTYLRDNYRAKCPPGLARKHNGCLPPGIAKKYGIGRPLPEGVEYRELPGDLLRELHHAPHGYRYVRVDKDVLLISEATKKVVDAVTLLSAVGN
ncbi:MAG: hypothetical protein GC185_09525 [Alphaproteobacteria bacterium]|nr:hypothetical protein [Alphaproteobacteria bacterium]